MLPLHSSDEGYKPGLKITEKIRGWLRFVHFFYPAVFKRYFLFDINPHNKNLCPNLLTYNNQNIYIFRMIFSDSNSRNLFMFLILNLSMAFVELLYGIWTNRYHKITQYTMTHSKNVLLFQFGSYFRFISHVFRLHGFTCRFNCITHLQMACKWKILIWVNI